jgi:hypothetical protein
VPHVSYANRHVFERDAAVERNGSVEAKEATMADRIAFTPSATRRHRLARHLILLAVISVVVDAARGKLSCPAKQGHIPAEARWHRGASSPVAGSTPRREAITRDANRRYCIDGAHDAHDIFRQSLTGVQAD